MTDIYGNTIKGAAFTYDVKSAYPKELMPKWWQFKAKALIRENAREMQRQMEAQKMQLAFMEALKETLRHTNIATNSTLHHTYAERPPAPRPSRLTVVYGMQNGQEWKEYVPLNGSHEWVTSPLHIVFQNPDGPPSYIRYEFGYTDGRRW